MKLGLYFLMIIFGLLITMSLTSCTNTKQTPTDVEVYQFNNKVKLCEIIASSLDGTGSFSDIQDEQINCKLRLPFRDSDYIFQYINEKEMQAIGKYLDLKAKNYK